MKSYDPCLNCGERSFTDKFFIKRFDRYVSICQKCGLAQVNPRVGLMNFADNEDPAAREHKLDNLFGLMKKELGPNLKAMMEKETDHKRDHFKKRVRDIERYKKSGKLLDVGCGQGAFLSACIGSGFQLYGVEPSKHTYAVASEVAPGCTLQNCTLQEAKFPGNNFDVVTIINTLEHLLIPKETVTEAHRILSPGGLLVIETPNVAHWIVSLMRSSWVQFLVPDHIVFFSKDTLTSMLNDIGFEVREIKAGSKTMSVRFFLFHTGRYLGGLSRLMLKVSEKIHLADKTISIPQWDAMVVFAVKK
jgi:2-polyprenyl-3-methyl-5-hydroxy-6-metoxy-1,4-benzoquinol methylase